MKKSKGKKWIIGTLGALGLAALLQEVKINPAFGQAVGSADTGKKQTASAGQTGSQDPVMDDWASQRHTQGSQTTPYGGDSSSGSLSEGRSLSPNQRYGGQDQPPTDQNRQYAQSAPRTRTRRS
jgi:hypothetical protein